MSSRVSISDFKTNIFPKNKQKLIPADDMISLSKSPPKVEPFDDDYNSSDESDYNFPDIQITEIVEKSPDKSPEKSYKKPLQTTKQDDPFLKDLTARLQLKQRQKKAEETSVSSNKEKSKSPKHISSKASPNTTPIHQFSLFKSKEFDKDSSATTPAAATTPKRFNLHSFNLNKSDSNGSKKTSPTHSATETFTRNFNKLNFNYTSLSKSSSKDKSTKDLSKKESPTKKLFSKIESKDSKPEKQHNELKIDPKPSENIRGRKFLELPLKRRSISPKEPRKPATTTTTEKVPLRNLKTPMFSMLKTPTQTEQEKPITIPKRNFFTPSKKDLATPLVTDPPKIKIPASPSKPTTPSIPKEKVPALSGSLTKSEKPSDSEEVF